VAEFRAPRVLYTGWGTFAESAAAALAEVGITRPVLVTDPVVGGLATIRAALAAAAIPLAGTFDGIPGEPTTREVAAGLAAVRAARGDGIIAIGGGAVLDTAKAIALLWANPGTLPDFMGANRFAQPGLPVIAVPTTAGTGSEVTRFTVIVDPLTQVKMLITDDKMVPRAAIVDPSLTVDAPPRVSASAGVDALTHAIEAYVSRRANPLADSLALAAIGHLSWSLPRVVRDGTDRDARTAAAIGALEAGLAFSNASVALVHGMSRPLGAVFGVPHGIANSMLLPTVMAYSAEAAAERYREIARIFGRGSPLLRGDDLGVETIRAYCAALGIPSLSRYGITAGALSEHAPKMAQDALASGSPANNPRVPTAAEIVELYTQAL
jgi:alcohol dehydrogenase class IV